MRESRSRSAAVTLRGLAEVDGDPTRVLAVFSWLSVVRGRRGGERGFRVLDADGSPVLRDGRPLMLRVPSGYHHERAADRLIRRALRRGLSDGSLDVTRAYPQPPRWTRVTGPVLVVGCLTAVGYPVYVLIREVGPWFGEFSVWLRALTVLAGLAFAFALLPARTLIVSMATPSRNLVRRARWRADGIDAELANGRRRVWRWADLRGMRRSADTYDLRFADGSSLRIPGGIYEAPLLYAVMECHCSPKRHRHPWRRSLLFVMGLLLVWNVAVVFSVLAEDRAVVACVLRAWTLPGAMAAGAVLLLLAAMLRYRRVKRSHVGRVRQRLSYLDSSTTAQGSA